MPPPPCALCPSPVSHIRRPKTHQPLCRTCFVSAFESEIHDTITTHKLFTPGERIAVAASGGKDSAVLASVLHTLNARHNYNLELVLLSVDEGIAGYRDASLAAVRRSAGLLGLELRVVGYGELYGWTMDEVVAQRGGARGSCTYCGVWRRQALDRGAEALFGGGRGHVVTGHNADDVAETVVMNLLRGDLPRLARATSIVTSSPASPIKRSKPLKYAYEKEIVLYAHHKKLDYFSTECIYSPEAFRGSARALIKNLERVRPSAILDVVRSGEDMARCVPLGVVGGGCAGGCDGEGGGGVTEEVDEGEGEGGCASANGRSSGGEMADKERQLRRDEDAEAEANEIEITSASVNGQKHDRDRRRSVNREEVKVSSDKKGAAKTPKKIQRQTMGKCQRCGYLSSQEVCKACVLLEGLNKNRPGREVAVAEESGGGDLVARVGAVSVADSSG